MHDQPDDPGQGPYGAEWLRAAPPGTASYVYQPTGYVPSRPDKGARNAMFGGLFSLVAVFLCWYLSLVFGPAAIVEGVRARRRIALSRGHLRGIPQAIIAIVTGAISTLIGVALVVLVIAIGLSPTPVVAR